MRNKSSSPQGRRQIIHARFHTRIHYQCQNTHPLLKKFYTAKEEMNRTATTLPCTCFRPGTKASLSEESDIGITG